MLTILPISFNRNAYMQNENNKIITTMKNDSFELSSKSNPSFGAISRKEIFACCDKVLKDIEKVTDCDRLKAIADDFFFNKLKKHVDAIGDETSLHEHFHHELVNAYRNSRDIIVDRKIANIANSSIKNGTDYQYLTFQKKEFKKAVDIIKSCTHRWSILERWDKQGVTVPFQDVLDLLKRMPPKSQYKNIQVEGLELLKGKNIENPLQFYTYVSQPLGNAIKYGENKPFKIKIEKVEQDGKNFYYASFINPDTKPIPNDEIDKITKGDFYRGANAKDSDIDGEGRGFYNIVKILKDNGYESDIPNLIEKGRKQGVHVRIPLIGVQD